MKLHWSPRSPFVRKVMIVLGETGQLDRVEPVRTVVAFATPPESDILDDNPLGKIPALVLDNQFCIFDSRVICEYLDGLHAGERLLPISGEDRLLHLRWQALGDGMTETLLLMRTEYLREQANAAILEGCRRKLFASLKRLEAEVPQLAAVPYGLGHISIICAIGQLDFRYARSNWQQAYPTLAAWYQDCSQRDAVKSTAPVDDADPSSKDTHSLLDFLQM